MISGQGPLMVLDTAAGRPHLCAGKVEATAVMSRQRLPSPLKVRTLAEPGLPDFEVTACQGLFVPEGTPADIVSRLSLETNRALAQPGLKSRLEDIGLEVLPGDAPALAAFLRKETAIWHALTRERRRSPE